MFWHVECSGVLKRALLATPSTFARLCTFTIACAACVYLYRGLQAMPEILLHAALLQSTAILLIPQRIQGAARMPSHGCLPPARVSSSHHGHRHACQLQATGKSTRTATTDSRGCQQSADLSIVELETNVTRRTKDHLHLQAQAQINSKRCGAV